MTRAIQPADGFTMLCQQVTETVAPSSGRIYQQTYSAWRAWCGANGLSPYDLTPAQVVAFLTSAPTTKRTRQRQLSALRKLAEYMADAAAAQGADNALVTRLQALHKLLLKIKVASADTATERQRRALSPREANRLLNVWDGGKPRDLRNRALVAVLLLGGVRRAEAAALRWRDIDFDNGILHIRHGKGDKARDVPLAGDYALEALRDWQLAQGSGREVVFCPMARGGNLGKDKPITGTDVYRVVIETGKLAGVEWKPHDARRTFITEALATGTPLVDVQQAAGHSRGSTTLGYAQAVDARKTREKLKLRYG